MILHSLHVINWRSILSPVNLGPFSEGLNVIHAPNGTGKSSLFEAMRRALFDSHLVTGKDIEAVRPWSRALAPQVAVDFTQSGVRYRVEKTFLDAACARLLRFEDGKFQPLTDSRNADAKLREILAADTPGRGLSKQEHWGCAQALWAPQGALRLDSISSNVTENLRAALGVQLNGESGSRLEEILEERYQTYFTKVGKPRTGKQAAPILALELERVTLLTQRNAWIGKQQEFEKMVRAVEDARQKRDQARRDAEALRGVLEQTRCKADVFQRLQDEKVQKRQAEQAAKERFDSLTQTLDLIRNTRHEITNLESTVQKGNREATELATELLTANPAVEECRKKREEARHQQTSVHERMAEVEDARTFLADTKARQVLVMRIEKLGRWELELNKQKQLRSKLVAPDQETIREVRKLLRACEKAETLLKASLIHLTVRPTKKTIIHLESPIKTRTIVAGKEATFSGSPEITIKVEGFGTIRATGPESDADLHEKALRESQKNLTKLTQPYGVPDPDRLQAIREEANGLDQKIEVLDSQIADLLNGEIAADLSHQLAGLDACIRELSGRFPKWLEMAPVVSELQSAFEAKRKEVKAEVNRAEDDFDRAQATAQVMVKRHGEVLAKVNQARIALEAATARFNDLTKDGQTDEARAETRRESLMAWEASRTAAGECETKFNQFPGDPQKDLNKLERQLKTLDSAESEARDDEKIAQGSLQTLAAEGAYSKLAECEEKLGYLEIRIQREKLRMDATRLLYDTVANCKAALVASVAAPVERNASHLLSRIAGPRLGTVRLTESFAPTGVHPKLMSEAVDLINLSGGEQEQLFLVTRLALGQLLANRERQLVVLDDVLTATDTGRLVRLLTLLEEAADYLQIIILTCHPERYRALEKAAFFDLQCLLN